MADVNANVYDEVSVAESVDLDIGEHSIDIFDSVTVSEVESVDTITFFGTDPRPEFYPKLPTASCEAAFRESISIEGEVPTVSGVGYFGTIVEGKAPTPSAEITLQGLYAGYISVTGKAPTPDVTAFFGGKVAGKVPTASCAATLVDNAIRVSGYAPVPSAEIEISNYFISVTGYSPFPSMTAELTPDGYITVEGKVPTVYGAITLSKSITITVTGTAPVVKAEYNDIQIGSRFISVTGNCPVISISKPTGEEDPGGISISEEDRFDDVTLQYSRWPDAI